MVAEMQEQRKRGQGSSNDGTDDMTLTGRAWCTAVPPATYLGTRRT